MFPRVIKPEEGKKLADSWGAAFMESSAKENEVMINVFFKYQLIGAIYKQNYVYRNSADDPFSMQTAVEVFKRIILEMEKADGNAAPEEKKCAVM